MAMQHEPWGAFAPSPRQQRFRTLAHRLPDRAPARKIASLLLGPAGGRARRPFDVAVFGTQRARLHPYDNISEKRVYLTPQHWDPKERAHLARAIKAHPLAQFVFVDVGANAGLYTLFARAAALAAGKSCRALCIEPDATMRARLAFNLDASGAGAEVGVAPFAATATDGPVAFSEDARNRGMSRIERGGRVAVEGRTLPRLLHEAGLTRIDALKIDVEGREIEALAPLFADPAAPRPALLIAEISQDGDGRPLGALIEGAGYAPVFANRLNAVYALRGAAP